jgi:hypothetical protein
VVTILDLLARTPHAPAADRAAHDALAELRALEALHHRAAAATEPGALAPLAGVDLPAHADAADAAISALATAGPPALRAAISTLQADWTRFSPGIGDTEEAPDRITAARQAALFAAADADAARSALDGARAEVRAALSAASDADRARLSGVLYDSASAAWGASLLSAGLISASFAALLGFRRRLSAAEAARDAALAELASARDAAQAAAPAAARPMAQGLQNDRSVTRIDPTPQRFNEQSGYTSSQGSGLLSKTPQSPDEKAATQDPAVSGS